MVKISCKVCGREFDTLPSSVKRGRKYCSVECTNKGLKGRTSPMKGRHHTEQTRLKISLHNGRGMAGKRPSEKSIQTLTNYMKEHGPWNKKYADPTECAKAFRVRNKLRLRERDKLLRPYENWNRRVDYFYRNLKARHDSELPYSLEEFRKWMNVQAKVCYLCRDTLNLKVKRSVQIDHVKSVRNGGNAELANLHLICRRCNEIKHSYTVEEVIETVEKWKAIFCRVQN